MMQPIGNVYYVIFCAHGKSHGHAHAYSHGHARDYVHGHVHYWQTCFPDGWTEKDALVKKLFATWPLFREREW